MHLLKVVPNLYAFLSDLAKFVQLTSALSFEDIVHLVIDRADLAVA